MLYVCFKNLNFIDWDRILVFSIRMNCFPGKKVNPVLDSSSTTDPCKRLELGRLNRKLITLRASNKEVAYSIVK